MLTLRSHRTGLLLGALLVSLSAPAHAQSYPTCDREPTADDVEGAKGAHKAAQRFYDKGQYEEAIRSWSDAYKFDCNAHPLLINIGNAYEKLGDRPRAIQAFQTYLDRMGANADPTIPDKLQNLKAQMERDRTPPPPTTTATEAPPPPPPPTTGGGEQPAADEGPGPWPWVLVGGGGAAIVVGAILLGVGSSKVSEAEDTCGDRSECNDPGARDLGNKGRTLQGAGYIVGAVGIVAVGGGLLWYFLAPDGSDDTATSTAWTVQPVVSPEVQGLSLGVSF